MTSSLIWAFLFIVVGVAIFVAYKWGQADQKRIIAETATERAKERHEIDEDVADMSDDELVERLRKHR
jgi:uncharacterized membrane protein